jgi:hypothetical protein
MKRGLGGSKGPKSQIIIFYYKPKSFTLIMLNPYQPWEEFQGSYVGFLVSHMVSCGHANITFGFRGIAHHSRELFHHSKGKPL